MFTILHFVYHFAYHFVYSFSVLVIVRMVLDMEVDMDMAEAVDGAEAVVGAEEVGGAGVAEVGHLVVVADQVGHDQHQDLGVPLVVNKRRISIIIRSNYF